MSTSLKYSLLFTFYECNFYAFFFFRVLATCLDLITAIFDKAYKDVYISSRDIVYMHTILFVCIAGGREFEKLYKMKNKRNMQDE